MTVSVRPSKLNGAASSFLSGILREPLVALLPDAGFESIITAYRRENPSTLHSQGAGAPTGHEQAGPHRASLFFCANG